VDKFTYLNIFTNKALLLVDNEISLNNLNATINNNAFTIFIIAIIAIISVIILAVVYGILKNKSIYSIKYVYTHDELTGVYNQRKLCFEIDKKIENNEINVSVLVVGIKKFKLVNENFTAVEGDNILKFLAEEINMIGLSHSNYLYGRVKEEKFAIVSFNDTNMPYLVEERLKNSIDKYDVNYNLHLNFGLYSTDKPLLSRAMLDRALLGLSHSSIKYGNTFGIYDNNLIDRLKSEEIISSSMGDALINEEFSVYLQPKFDLITKEVVGAESLVRWIKKDGNMVYPNEFIPVFESNGFITKLDYYMIEKTCQIIKKWLLTGFKVVPISVNISRVDLFDKKLFDRIVSLVEKYDIPPRLLELEFTESVYFENEKEMIKVMFRLQNYGFRILMDDFGSGYSSFNMLSEYDVDVIKIDMRFLQQDNNIVKMHKIIKSIVHMAKLLELDITVEGVETEEQVLFLKNIGCSEGQGYYFSKPVKLEDFENIIIKQTEEGIFVNELEQIIEETPDNHNLDITAEDVWSLDVPLSILFNNTVNALVICERFESTGIRIKRVNSSYYNMIKVPVGSKVYQGNLVDLVESDDKSLFTKAINDCFDRREVVTVTYKQKITGGEIIWIKSILQPVGLIKEKPILCLEMINVTEQKSIEKEFNYLVDEQQLFFLKINSKNYKIERISKPLKKILNIGSFTDLMLEDLLAETEVNKMYKKLRLFDKNSSAEYIDIIFEHKDVTFDSSLKITFFEGINRGHFYIKLLR